MTDFSNQTLLVTGAGGHLGRIAVEELLARGATRVIAGTRDTAALSDLAARGAELRVVDFDSDDLAAALAGVDRMLLVSTVAANRREHQARAVAAAKAAGVRHIVYTSAPNARPNESAGGITDHYWTEVAIAASGLDFTLLRNHIYADTAIDAASPALASGRMFDATGDRGRNYVTRADAARTAAGALLTAEGQNILDVTGPAPVLLEEVARLVADISGKPVQRIGVTGDQLLEGLKAAGVPGFMAQLLVAFDLDAAAGHHEIVTDTVERFTGRQPESLAAFLRANADRLRT